MDFSLFLFLWNSYLVLAERRCGEREKGSYHERERLHFSFRGSAFTVADCRFVFGDAEMHSEDCLKKCSLTVSI